MQHAEKAKPVGEQIKSTIKTFRYEWLKKRLDADSLQEMLFLQHPDYKN